METKGKRKHKKNRKRIEGNRKEQEVSLDPYQKEGV